MNKPAREPNHPDGQQPVRRERSRSHPERTELAHLAPDGRPLPPPVAAVMRHGHDAWPAFLRAYTQFILGCIRRLAEDPDEQMDIYLHVCARLYADRCRRIRQFRGGTTDSPCKFTTWLAAVTLNLAREWIRQMRGRRRVFRVVKRMSMLHRLVFRYHYWEGFDTSEIRHLLKLQHGIDASDRDLEAVAAELRAGLGADRRWRLLSRDVRTSRHLSLDAPAYPRDEGSRNMQIAADQPDGDLAVRHGSAMACLTSAIERLPDMERDVIAMRFRDGLTARQIAERLEISSFKRVYELQAKALLKLRAVLRQEGWELDDFPLNGDYPESGT